MLSYQTIVLPKAKKSSKNKSRLLSIYNKTLNSERDWQTIRALL
jgi:hypothetical protein